MEREPPLKATERMRNQQRRRGGTGVDAKTRDAEGMQFGLRHPRQGVAEFAGQTQPRRRLPGHPQDAEATHFDEPFEAKRRVGASSLDVDSIVGDQREATVDEP